MLCVCCMYATTLYCNAVVYVCCMYAVCMPCVCCVYAVCMPYVCCMYAVCMLCVMLCVCRVSFCRPMEAVWEGLKSHHPSHRGQRSRYVHVACQRVCVCVCVCAHLPFQECMYKSFPFSLCNRLAQQRKFDKLLAARYGTRVLNSNIHSCTLCAYIYTIGLVCAYMARVLCSCASMFVHVHVQSVQSVHVAMTCFPQSLAGRTALTEFPRDC